MLRRDKRGTIPTVTLPRIQGALLAMLLCLGTAGALDAAEPVAPTGPGSLEEMPGGNRESVTRLLAKTRRRYGEDAVLIQTKLLLLALRNGSQLAAGVRVQGADDYAGREYLRFRLETGLVFDDGTRDLNARVHMLWLTLMEPTLESIGEPDMTQAGIAIEMESFHRPYESGQELRATIDNPGLSEEVTFYVLRDDLMALAHEKLTVRDLFTRSRITIDDSERAFAAPPEDATTVAGPL